MSRSGQSTSLLARILGEPLVHFVVAGAVLFTAFNVFHAPRAHAPDERTIVVDRHALLTFLQYRANAFDPKVFGTALESMSKEDLDELIDAYVNEEALYRESKLLGLDASDYVMRQRMVQKMSFQLRDLSETVGEVDESALEDYFAANRETYAVEPSVTFTHIFFDAERRGEDQARADAEAAILELNETGAQFNDATVVGDRFPFLKNYVDRTFDFVASHFGTQFAASLEQLEPAPGKWRGPLRSAYGYHAVLVTRHTPKRYPELSEVLDNVKNDYLRERSNETLAQMTQALRDRYDVVISDDIRNASGDDTSAGENSQ